MDQADFRALLMQVVDAATAYRDGIGDRPHRPELSYEQMRARFEGAAPECGAPASAIVAELAALAPPGLAAMIGPRFFGWVIGGTEPAGLAADWLTSAWGQNAGNALATPAACAVEEVAGRWLLQLMDLPRESSVGFVTGATMANFTCLAAARDEVLRRMGWDVEADGLFGAPPINVVLGAEAHSTVFSALKYLGLGAARVIKIDADTEGRMRADALARTMRDLSGPSIVIAQAGHINSGAFDPFADLSPIVREHGAWLHVDGAFGLWARADKAHAALAHGVELADSWGTDGHKWLQTPHDSGYAIVRHPDAHRRAMLIAASYLPEGEYKHPADYVPELSRRARGFATWAMIKALGSDGIAAMVNRHCSQARRFAERLAASADIEILNDVVLNQVAVRLGAGMPDKTADALTLEAIARIQADGVCFVGGAHWRGRQIVRISVIGASTTEADIDRSADAIISAWRAARAANR